MYRYEVAWHEKDGTKYGLTKFRCFTQKEKYEKFLRKLRKNPKIRILQIADNTSRTNNMITV